MKRLGVVALGYILSRSSAFRSNVYVQNFVSWNMRVSYFGNEGQLRPYPPFGYLADPIWLVCPLGFYVLVLKSELVPGSSVLFELVEMALDH